jgi:hypothetical protein
MMRMIQWRWESVARLIAKIRGSVTAGQRDSVAAAQRGEEQAMLLQLSQELLALASPHAVLEHALNVIQLDFRTLTDFGKNYMQSILTILRMDA